MLLLVCAAITKADSPQATIESLATKDLLAVGYADLNTIKVEECLQWAVQQKLVPADRATKMNHLTGMAQEFLRQATKAGADHVIALVKQDDLRVVFTPSAPLIAISIADGHEAEKTIKSLRPIVGLLQIPNFEMETWNNVILAGTAEQIANAKSGTVTERHNLAKAWETIGGHNVGVMIFASQDTRRVVRELFPVLQPPFENATGELIADHVTHIGVAVDLPEKIGGMIVAQTTDGESAETIKHALEELKKLLIANESGNSAMASAVTAISALEPTIDDNDVVLDLSPILNDKVQLTSLLEPIQANGRRSQKMRDMRQIILAMHNYESKHKTFPAYANFDADGKPLLSWRVHLLPFLEQNALYKQFKLDEPWDSPHNIKWANTIPARYADPSLELDETTQAAKTRIVVPFGEGTMFQGNEGTTFGAILDGSSNTIAVATVAPKQAVIWTKPVDWNVDLKNPKAGIFDDQHKEAVFAISDGSVQLILYEAAVEQLKAMLTKAGGEVDP